MQINGLIFAGGKGRRMKAPSKPMVSLMGKSLISYGIEALLDNGITDITIIRNANDDNILSLLDVYKNSEANITFLDDSFQKGAHFAYLHFEQQLRFPLISLDCDIYFEPKDFSEMINKALKVFNENPEVESTVAVSLSNPFNEPKSIIVENNRVIDYIEQGAMNGYYGGFMYIWRKSPCLYIRHFYKQKEENQTFINFYAKYNLMIPMTIRCVWDIDTPERIVESEELISSLNNQESVYKNVIEYLKKQKDILSIALGGSRSRKCFSNGTDYDLFCLIDDKEFEEFRKNFSNVLLEIPDIILAVEAFYLEHFGFLFKALSSQDIQFDISILPLQRAGEMGIRSTNIILYDPLNIYFNLRNNANDEVLLTDYLEKNKINDYIGLFYFEWLRFKKSFSIADYWLALKSVERMKIYYMHTYRIVSKRFANTPHCPEKKFGNECNDKLKNIYVIDGNLTTLKNTALSLKRLFEESFHPMWMQLL